jgi:transposase
MPSYEELLQEISELRQRAAEQQRQIEERERQVEEQQRQIEEKQRRLEEGERQVEDLRNRIAQLEKLVDELQRRGKRQASPFSKGKPKSNPKRPGRKAGDQYGRQSTRARPDRVDETIEVECPQFCEHCQGEVVPEGTAEQYQVDLPEIRPRVTKFILHYGKCSKCGREVLGRHPRQTSQAFRVGNVQLGPEVLGLVAFLNKVAGVSYGKIVALLKEMAGLRVSRSALCRALLRMGKKLAPLYEELKTKIRHSPVVYPDETSWREGGHKVWLWVFTNGHETVYSIQPGRGYNQAVEVLGAGYCGVLVADGWAPYQKFEEATHQTCLAHLLRRCEEMLEKATAESAGFPQAVKEVLQAALALRDQRDAGKVSGEALTNAKTESESQMDRLLSEPFSDPSNRRLAQHLIRHQDQLFLFLVREDVEATNWPAEQAIRPAVINRKTSGGNRTPQGSNAQGVLMSIFRTFQQHQLSPLALVPRLLQSPHPLKLDSLLPSPQPL